MSDNEMHRGAKVINLQDARRRRVIDSVTVDAADFAPMPTEPKVSKVEQLQARISSMAEEKRALREYQNLADALLVRAQIPNGTALIVLLGDGTERDNRDVIVRWVCRNRHLIHVARHRGVDVLGHLHSRLMRDLDERAGGREF